MFSSTIIDDDDDDDDPSGMGARRDEICGQLGLRVKKRGSIRSLSLTKTNSGHLGSEFIASRAPIASAAAADWPLESSR